MPDDGSRHQIILLPVEDYWDWVEGARDYAVHYRASVTAYPENAVRYRRPNQVITVVDAPYAYEEYGSIVDWLREQAPEVTVDVVTVRSAAQLHDVLSERIQYSERFGELASAGVGVGELPLQLQWPTDHPVITQPFGASPDIYRRWGLPGHEGIDFRAPINSHVYACADGEVYMVHDGTGGHAYGIHVRIRHEGGYKTIYAHLNQATVHTGQTVRSGELIGLANSTGNSAHSHLHLVLKRDGATNAALTDYPSDIIDPTPFLAERPLYRPEFWQPDWWPYDESLVGLHARIGGPMEEPDWDVVRLAGIEALKFTSSAASGDVARARAINPDMFVLVQLTTGFDGRPVTATEFVARVWADMERFYAEGVRLFEVHDEPNLTPEGYGTSWQSGEEFGQWFTEVTQRLRIEFPSARFGWPGLSAGPSTSGMRMDHRAFLASAGGAITQADWIGCHCHWETPEEMLGEDGGLAYQFYRDEWPEKLLLITEFSNPSLDVSARVRGKQYVEFLNMVRSASDVGAAFGFVVSSARNYPYERWRTEDGDETAVVEAVAARER